ncbi:MAG: hypothetical protein EBR82_51455 [Caulobacteraceae bacterium]|nr:hypothetical protein [Caulobacteraceae bacterium]
MSKTIHDIKGLAIGDKVAITISNPNDTTTCISGICTGIQALGEKENAGLTIKGIPNWIWIEDNMVVTWISDN